MSFAVLLRAHPFRPMQGCPGRYVLPGLSSTTPEQLVGGEGEVLRFSVAAARDPVVVVRLEGGGLISYQQADGRFLHTLGDAEGFARKIEQLGIVLGG